MKIIYQITKKYFLIAACLCLATMANSQTHTVNGRVADAVDGIPLANVSIREVNSAVTAKTDSRGYFDLVLREGTAILNITHLGYESHMLEVTVPHDGALTIMLQSKEHILEEVTVSTGYEEIPMERATGVFEKIDNTLLNRSVSMDILSRLEHVTSGIHFEKSNRSFNEIGRRSDHSLYIHGISTLRGGTTGANAPLIVLDNFPFEGDINNINPNDIESVTVLKDAAAASIWGAKAGNGVIVMTSKQARYAQPIRMSFNANTSVTWKPDLYQHRIIKTSDYIDIEQYLFARGFYTAQENNRAKPALSPVVEILIKQRDGVISEHEAQRQIDAYRGDDVRDDMLRYMYREAIQQQYALNLSGGSQTNRFLIGAGYDRSLPSQVGNRNSRTTVRVENTYMPIQGLELQSSLRWVSNENRTTTLTETYSDIGYKFPYISLADENGDAIPVPKDYRLGFLDTAGNGQLLDWHYRPLDEVRNPPIRNTGQALLFNLGLRYDINTWLSADVKYQFGRSNFSNRQYSDLNSYDTRNQINRGTQLVDDAALYHFPFGGILRRSSGSTISQFGRGQINVNKEWDDRNEIHAIAGFDISDRTSQSDGFVAYGYDDGLLTYANPVDHTTRYPVYGNLAATGIVPYPVRDFSETTNRFVSVYANASYVLSRRYTASMSARRDASNLFGLSTNDKWTPLWSAGLSWLIHKEPFFGIGWIDVLKLRATFGYSGNVDNSMSALTTMYYSRNNGSFGVNWPDAQITSPPNANLRWEKVGNMNLGVDFSFLGGLLSGNLDIYQKNTRDLLDLFPTDPSTGVSTMTMNVGNTRSRGVDARISAKILSGTFNWRSSLLFSYNNNWITESFRDYTGPSSYVNIGSLSRLAGTLAFPAYSYRWGGLNPSDGQPRGLIDGQPTTDYRTITSNRTALDDLVFHGSARPLYFGSWINNFQYGNLSLSINLSWKFDYYFRRAGMNYMNMMNSGDAHEDFYRRWQSAGDESHTHVPSFVYPVDSRANAFYQQTEVLVEKGDHIRIQDIRVGYRVPNAWMFKGIEAAAMINNIGFLWRANELGLDPDNGGNIPTPRNVTFSLTINL